MGDQLEGTPTSDSEYDAVVERFLKEAFHCVDKNESLAQSYNQARAAVLWLPMLDCDISLIEKWRDAIERVYVCIDLESSNQVEYVLFFKACVDVLNDYMHSLITLSRTRAYSLKLADCHLRGLPVMKISKIMREFKLTDGVDSKNES